MGGSTVAAYLNKTLSACSLLDDYFPAASLLIPGCPKQVTMDSFLSVLCQCTYWFTLLYCNCIFLRCTAMASTSQKVLSFSHQILCCSSVFLPFFRMDPFVCNWQQFYLALQALMPYLNHPPPMEHQLIVFDLQVIQHAPAGCAVLCATKVWLRKGIELAQGVWWGKDATFYLK